MFLLVLLLNGVLSLTSTLTIFPDSPTRSVKFSTDPQLLHSSSGPLIASFSLSGTLPKPSTPSSISSLGLLRKRVDPRVLRFNALPEFIPSSNATTLLLTGNVSESLALSALSSFTHFSLSHLGRANTRVFNPIAETFLNISAVSSPPNAWFYSFSFADLSSPSINSIDNALPINIFDASLAERPVASSYDTLFNSIVSNVLQARNDWNISSLSHPDVFYQRLELDLVSNTFSLHEIAFLPFSHLPLLFPSSTDSFRRTLLFLSSCGNDYQTSLPVCKFSQFNSFGEHSRIIDASPLASSRPLPVYIHHLAGSGFHREIETTLFNFNSSSPAQWFFLYTLPPGVFVDIYQLAEQERKDTSFRSFTYEPMDLEAPIQTARPTHLILQLQATHLMAQHFTFPIHLRYHHARTNATHETALSFGPPTVFLKCGDCTPSPSVRMIEGKVEGMVPQVISCGTSEPSQFLGPVCEPQFPEYRIPVGQLDAFPMVSVVTLATTALGAFVVVVMLVLY